LGPSSSQSLEPTRIHDLDPAGIEIEEACTQPGSDESRITKAAAQTNDFMLRFFIITYLLRWGVNGTAS
jgi:hypothetical protein